MVLSLQTLTELQGTVYTTNYQYDDGDKATAPALAPYLHPVGNITAINYDVQGSTNVADAGRIGATNGEETIYECQG